MKNWKAPLSLTTIKKWLLRTRTTTANRRKNNSLKWTRYSVDCSFMHDAFVSLFLSICVSVCAQMHTIYKIYHSIFHCSYNMSAYRTIVVVLLFRSFHLNDISEFYFGSVPPKNKTLDLLFQSWMQCFQGFFLFLW